MPARPGPEPEFVINVTADAREVEMLAALARLTGFSVSDIIRQAIRQQYRENFDEVGQPREGSPRITPEYAWALARESSRSL